ncbi:hypothetical protein I5M27_01080 [Adhaeribacter sp. BT258]|uniref:Uncharacterized protein n=1 Tax=Adhaeribacter terrigena TaxID=2793070 RepID=A0ABS1BZ56_9BACT|nr:hypothetical protein [Adhaeribacter terrigena]MBK0401555.1 hypothetical protein [Adhaeribacter terrigena]
MKTAGFSQRKVVMESRNASVSYKLANSEKAQVGAAPKLATSLGLLINAIYLHFPAASEKRLCFSVQKLKNQMQEKQLY